MPREIKIYQYLESSALISDLPDPVQHQVHDLLAHCVVTSRVVVSGILFAGDHLGQRIIVGNANFARS